MTPSKKKIIALLAAVALISGAVVSFGGSATDKPMEPLFGNSNSLFANDPNVSVGSGGGLNTQELFLKMTFAVLLVMVLGIAAVYVSKKFGARIANLPGKKIRIIETIHLGGRKRIHLLKVGDQELLIASTNENITKLADITAALSEMDLPRNQTDNN